MTATNSHERCTKLHRLLAWAFVPLCLHVPMALAGAQVEEPLSASVRAGLQHAISDRAATRSSFRNENQRQLWLGEMSKRLQKHIPDAVVHSGFLQTVHYEATRAGLDPQMVLGLIQVESAFKKYAVSRAGARGYMQVMPFWVRLIGTRDQNLFHLRTNLRYGCTILRHYLDVEKGNLFRALGRYNGSLGQPDYPYMVLGAWRNHWSYTEQTAQRSTSPGNARKGAAKQGV
ncbi:MAG: lytic transglycosylase domain-containing protein [Burkholderiales bacterium]